MVHHLSVWAATFIAAVLTSSASGKTAFQVTDSIEMVRIVAPDVALAVFKPPDITLSPDGQYFLLGTRRGNISTDKNDYRLLLYRTADIEAFLNQSGAALPQAEILLEVATSHNHMPFQKITWLKDGETIAFIGRFDERDKTTFGQVHSLNIATKALHRLTRHPRPVTNFALDSATQRIIFASTIARRNPDRTKSSYLAGVRNINGIIDPDWEYPEPAVRYYIQPAGSLGKPQPVGGLSKGFFLTDISLSPDGRHAIFLTTSPQVPRHWLENYAFLKDDFSRRALRDFDENTMMRREDLTTRLALVDMATGETRPLIDAPTGLWKGGSSVGVRWLPDSRSVILGNVALPVTGRRGARLARLDPKHRTEDFFTVAYDLDQGSLTPIARHPAKRNEDDAEGDEGRGQFYGLDLSASGQVTLRQKRRGAPLPDRHFIQQDGEWRETSAAPPIKQTALHLSIHQDLNNPPELMARDTTTGRRKIISDFNPQLRDRTLGRVEAISWTAPDGRIWHGGLVYPPRYGSDVKTRRRYPLVIQTHGFNGREFLIDGPHGVASAFAAQALANRDIMVLQMAEPRVAQSRAELLAYRAGFESAIDHLAGLGLVDRQKVGLIGWSATGVDVQHMLISSTYPIAAAVIADSYNFGMFGYINQFGARAPGMAHIENILGGATPWGAGLDHWVARNPALHLDRISTPIRYEQYETGLSSWWETYALLKRQQKPVEYYVFNDAAHALIKPRHRLTSQRGSLDWFTFWLKDEENPDPARVSQYDRWRRLRTQQEHSQATAIKARRHDAMQQQESDQEP